MKEKQFFEEKLVECAEIQVDAKETYKPKLRQLEKIFKFGFGQKPADFKLLLKYLDLEEGAGKMQKLMETFIALVRYYNFMGVKEEKIDRILENFGMKVDVTDGWSPVDGPKVSPVKYRVNWNETYQEDVLAPGAGLLEFLINEGLGTQNSIDALTGEASVIVEEVESKCEIGKSSFKKGVGLKVNQMSGKDIGETVQKIERGAEELAEIIEVL